MPLGQRKIATGLVTMVTVIGLTTTPALASGSAPQAGTTASASTIKRAPEGRIPPVPQPGSRSMESLAASPRCSAPVKGKMTCLQVKPSDANATRRAKPAISAPATSSLLPFPEWCTRDVVSAGSRTEACGIYELTYSTYFVPEDASMVQTGELALDAYGDSYSAVDNITFAHQFALSAWSGWGDALDSTISGVDAYGDGDCTLNSWNFPTQSVLPYDTLHGGESFFDTTATATGAIGYCTTGFDYIFTTPGYGDSPYYDWMNGVRCDNAVGANGFRPARAGCVMPWYPSTVNYSSSTYPSLAAHVSEAQASGLPGDTYVLPLRPLHRTTNTATINTNRTLACGSAPSIPGLSCDEYPLASTSEGLASGGSLRTFSGCQISAPQSTGPTGVSACMITASENNAQGALQAAFYYDARILDTDPYLVTAGL